MNFTDNGNVSSLNWTINSTINQTQEIIYEISTASHITNVVISILTVVLNGAMIRCLQTCRSKIPEAIFQQLMSLSISDVIAGFTPATSCFTFIGSINRSSKACAAVLATFSIAQYAVLLNLCVLSCRRWCVLRNATKPTTRNEQNLLWTILCTVSSWLASVLVSAIAMSAAITGKSSVNGCLSPELYDNVMAMKLATVTYFATLLLLNVFNIISAVTLKRLNEPNTTGTNTRRQEVQQRAFRHLLAVLMVTNVTTIPLIVLSVINGFREKDLGPGDMYAVTYFQALNSLINPVLYSAHINEIRDAIKARLVSVVRRKRNTTRGNEISDSPYVTNSSTYVTAT